MKLYRPRIFFVCFFLFVFLISTLNIIKIYSDYKTADNVNENMQDRFVQAIKIESEPPDEEVKIQAPICIDFDSLIQENNDVIGWIYCPNTPINYPVLKGEDNNKYLRTDLKGNYLVSGSIFADYRNGKIGQYRNYIVYGHNMKNSTMFGTLVKYKDQTYYDSHPILYFLTPDANYIIELCAGAVVKRDSDIYQTAPADNTIADIMAKSTFNSAVEIGNGENIITLSTCSYEFNNARYVVVGKLKKI